MFETEASALALVGRVAAVAIIFQTLEYFQIRKTVSESGVWRWSVLRKDFEVFPGIIRWPLSVLLRYPHFMWMVMGRGACACVLLLVFHPVLVVLLFGSTLLIAMRWRGTFNGGSDCMTLIVLLALSIAAFFEEYALVARGCLWYISIQVCASYFIAGVVKVKNRNWQTGKALSGFLNSACYELPPLARSMMRRPGVARACSWLVMGIECVFPVALLSPEICIVFIGMAFCFHIANAYLLGLNRFVFAWAAAYPALYFCSTL